MSDDKIARVGVISPSEATMKVGEKKTFTVTGDTIRTAYTANGKLSIEATTQTSTSVTVIAMTEGEDALNIIFVNDGTASVPIHIVSESSGGGGSGGDSGGRSLTIETASQGFNPDGSLDGYNSFTHTETYIPFSGNTDKIIKFGTTGWTRAIFYDSNKNRIGNADSGSAVSSLSMSELQSKSPNAVYVRVSINQTTTITLTGGSSGGGSGGGGSPTVPVTGVSLNKSSTSLTVGKTEILTATVTPTNATNKAVTWSSNNTTVATVDNGTIRANAKGSATITVRTSDGNKTATCAVTVTETTTPTPPPPTNNAPTISFVLVSNETSSGGYTLSYTATDPDGDTLTHKLKLDAGGYSTISPTKSGTSYTFNGSGLSVGTHTGQIQVSDGSLTATSEVFNITIRAQATGVKAQLKEAKDIYDEKHTALKTTINSVIADGKFNETTEKSQLDQAFSAYNSALAQFKKMAQKAIDFIGDAKKDTAIDESKVYTNAQIKVVSDSITQRVDRVEEKQTSVDGKVSALETWKSSAEQKITADAIINTVSSTITQAKNEAIGEANANTTNALKNYSTTTQMNSAIQQKADSITSTVSSTVNQAKQDAITSANKSTDDKLKNYSTTTQMNSVIQQKADSINATVSANYTDLNGKIQSANTAITQTADKIASKVDSNGVKSIIEQSSDSVKVGFNGITNAIVMSQTGIRMNSNAGAYTQFSSNGMSSFNNSSQQTLGIKNGGITFHPWNGTQLGAYITQSALHSGTTSANGLAISTANNGAYLSLGTSSMSDANSTLNMDQALTISSNDNFQPKGINFWKDVHAHGYGIRQLSHLKLAGSGAIQFDYLNNSPSTIYEAVDSGHSLYVMGGYQLHLGCMDGSGSPKGVIWMRDSKNTHSYTHWDFHNYTMYNMKTASTYANYDTRRIGESYGVTSNVDGVRYLYKNVELVNGKAIRSIPLEYKGCEYDIVSIVCKGRGSAWVETEGENRFEINGDCKSVNIEIIIYPSEAVMTASTQQLEEAPTLELPKKTEPEEALIITNEAV